MNDISAHTSALHPSEVRAPSTGGENVAIVQEKSAIEQLSHSSPQQQTGASHSVNEHPVVAKSGIDLSTGVQRPAETHATSGTFSNSSNTTGSSNSTGTAQPTVTGLRQRAGSITNTVGEKVNSATSNVGAQLNAAGNNVSKSVAQAADHPVVQNAKQGAVKQVESFREVLGRYPIIVNAEKRTGVDRVGLVIGGAFLYFLLIPLNLFGLALPTTQLLTFLPPTFLALRTLDTPNEERTKTLLSYFVVFGFVQFAESLMAGFLEKRIPQYYTVKLLFLAYLIHPKTKGARKIYSSVLQPLLARAQEVQKHAATTPPTTKPSSANSPTFPSSNSGSATHSSGAGADVPLSQTAGFSSTGPSSTGHSGAPASAGSNFGSAQSQGYNNTSGAAQAAAQIHLPSGGGTGVGQEVPKY